jgi:HEAT repeat protein
MGFKKNPPPAKLPDNLPLAALKQRKAEEIAAARYKAEIGGMDFYGVPIATDDRSKSLLFAAYGEAAANPDFEDRWKGADGIFRPVDAATIIALYDALRAHVTACFAREAALLDVLNQTETPENVHVIAWDMEISDEALDWTNIE